MKKIRLIQIGCYLSALLMWLVPGDVFSRAVLSILCIIIWYLIRYINKI